MEALDVLSLQPDYIAADGMQAALEEALGGAELPERPSFLVRLLQGLAELGWEGSRIQLEVQRRWGRSSLAALALSEIRSWQVSLGQAPPNPNQADSAAQT